MGWGIDFTAEIYLSRQDYQENIILVNDKITEIDQNIEIIKSKLKMFGSSTIKDIIPEEWTNEPINWINAQMEELIQYYDELLIDRYNLTLYKEYLSQK